MARRRTDLEPQAATSPAGATGARGVAGRAPRASATRVVIVSPRRGMREALRSRLEPRMASVMEASDASAASVLALDADVLVIDAEGAKAEWGVAVAGSLRGPAAVLVGDERDADLLGAALRAGAAGVIAPDADAARLAALVDVSADRVRAGRGLALRLERRNRRLRALCRGLFASRHELMKQVGSLCEQMAGSYRAMAGQVRTLAESGELAALLRQELDLENLLRTTLEYALKKLGPTNAAIFLPDSAGDYTLGAYVNYDCAKDAAESMLDHLADIAAPAFESRDDVVVLRSHDELGVHLGRAADWLGDSTLVAQACRHKGECAAVVVFFRDRRHPFTSEHADSVRVMGTLFAEQLTRVIHTHHRHIPKDQWGRPGDGGVGPDDADLAA